MFRQILRKVSCDYGFQLPDRIWLVLLLYRAKPSNRSRVLPIIITLVFVEEGSRRIGFCDADIQRRIINLIYWELFSRLCIYILINMDIYNYHILHMEWFVSTAAFENPTTNISSEYVLSEIYYYYYIYFFTSLLPTVNNRPKVTQLLEKYFIEFT